MPQDNNRQHTGNVTPQDLADRSLHQQNQIFETENRPDAPGSDLPAGDAAGPDTTGVVAELAELGKPGISGKLGGTPGANATQSGGRSGDYGR